MSALKVWDGTAWVYAKNYSSGAVVNATAPTNPTVGKLWYDTSISQLKTWDGSAWRETYSASGQGTWAGPWSTAAPAGSTSGVAFTISKAGYYRFIADATAYSGAGGSYTITFYIDGANKGSRAFYINQVSTHMPWPRVTWTALMTAGTHYFYVQANLNSDAQDTACLSWDLI